jgi:hypothetical protein
MRYVKLFEEFNEGGPKQSASTVYIYYVHKSGDDNFEADVRDPDGKVVYELSASDLSNDGHMKNKDDIPGLVQLLIGKNKIKPGDTVVPASQAKADIAAETFAPEVNTNAAETTPNPA